MKKFLEIGLTKSAFCGYLLFKDYFWGPYGNVVRGSIFNINIKNSLIYFLACYITPKFDQHSLGMYL